MTVDLIEGLPDQTPFLHGRPVFYCTADPDGVHVTFRCPACGHQHLHGGSGTPSPPRTIDEVVFDRDGDGHRHAHCPGQEWVAEHLHDVHRRVTSTGYWLKVVDAVPPWQKPLTPTSLYRLRCAQGGLLYVGVSHNWAARMAQHATTKPWWDQVASVSVQHFPDRAQALDAERNAIIDEQPQHNIQWRGDPR